MIWEKNQEKRSIFNKIRHIKAIVDKLISITKNNPTTYHIGDVFKISLHTEWYDSIFSNDEKMAKLTKLSATFACSLLQPEKKNYVQEYYLE